MNTPITDANVASLTKTPDCFCEASLARRLELDRAALMKALDWLDAWLGHKPMPECSKRIRRALATARANFP